MPYNDCVYKDTGRPVNNKATVNQALNFTLSAQCFITVCWQQFEF